MINQIEKDLYEFLPKKNVKVNEPMSKHTSFQVGGIADYFVTCESTAELKKVLKYVNDNNIELTLIGNGTNCLICDEGIRGIVLKLEFKEYKIFRNKEYARIVAGAGLPVCMLSNIALKEELSNLEFLCGIPGTIGGAIYMNAGAYGSEMKDIVFSTKYIDRKRKYF